MKTIVFKISFITFLLLNPICFVISQWLVEDTLNNGDALFRFISTVDSSVVWAAGTEWSSGEKLIYRRNLSGTWDSIPLNGISGTQAITCLAAVNSQSAIIGTGHGNALLYRTTNSGLNWQVVASTGGTNGYFNDARFSQTNPAYGYAWSDPPLGNGSPFKIFKTSNYGQNWSEYSFLYNANYVGASPSICVTDSNHAWFGLNKNLGGTDFGKILFTSNGGLNFSVLSSPLIGRFVTSVEFKQNNVLGYVTILEQSVYFGKTTNGGTNWLLFSPGFTISSCQRIISIPNSNTWYALNTATSMGNRVLKSTNEGNNWLPMQLPGGQYDVQFMDAVLDNNKATVYAVSTEGYVLRLSDTVAIVGVSSNNSEIPKDFRLQQNYPNPFNPITTIEYSVPKKEFVNISLHDILGRIVMQIENSVIHPGNYSIQIDCRELASGVYFYKMNAGDYIDAKKMIILK